MAPYFFFSYAHGEDADYFGQFYEDLSKEVAEVTTRSKAEVGFRDVSGIGLGRRWRPELVQALSTCACFVPLLAPRLAVSPYCGKEWRLFQDRLDASPAPDAGKPARLLPVLWRPLGQEVPDVFNDYQRLHERLGATYAEKGLLKLLKLDRYKDEYDDFLSAFAQMMVDAVAAAPLTPFDETVDIESVPDAFAGTPAPVSAGRRPDRDAGRFAVTHARGAPGNQPGLASDHPRRAGCAVP